MLDKTNYTTRTDLEHEEVMALVEVREDLLSGKISAQQFNMSFIMVPIANDECGSIGCIGGWAGIKMGLDFMQTECWMNGSSLSEVRDRVFPKINYRFRSLFFPKYWNATPADGAKAITRFLNGDNDPWVGL